MITRTAALLLLLCVSACSESSVDVPTPTAATIDVLAGGAVNGTFQAVLLAVWNKPSAKGLTKFSLLGQPSKALNIESFALDATIVGLPKVGHYAQSPNQISASMTLGTGALLESIISSQNRIDITGVGELIGMDDGSAGVPLHGTVAGSVTSRESPDTVNFLANF